MKAQIVPLEACFKMPGPGSYEDQRGMLPMIRERSEREVKRKLLDQVEKNIQIEEEPEPFRGDTIFRARLWLADGWGDIEAMRRQILSEAEQAMRNAMHQWSVNNDEAKALAADRAKFAAEMEQAQADFRRRFQASLEEFWGYDECTGRR